MSLRPLLLASLLLVSPAFAQQWAVPGAPMRFKAEIDSQPSTPDAGVIAVFPNGGALPGPVPNAVVIDSAGKELPSQCIWNNPQEGYAIVFPAPLSHGPVWIYLEGRPNLANPWTPDSPLHPGLLLYTRAGHASLSDARNLGDEHPPGQGSRMGQVPMIADGHNRFGPSNSFVSYYTGWLDFPESGAYFIATISSDGSTVLVDGQPAADWPGLHPFNDGATGNKGTTVTLTKGPHRIEYFQFSTEGTPRSQLVWRLPSAAKDSIPKNPRSFIKSGSVFIIAAESRTSVPPALFNRVASSYMDFNDQFVDLYDLSVPLSDQYNGVSFDWTFSDGSRAQGSHLLWPIPRGTPLTATLTVTRGGNTSSSTRALYPDVLPPGAQVDSLSDRRDYAQGLLNRLQGAPDPAHPAAAWPASFWVMLPQVVEGGEAKDLLAFLFQHCNADLANLSADDRTRLGAIYYDELKQDKEAALPILRAILAAEKDPGALFNWQIRAIDFELLEMGDIPAARQLANSLRADPFHGGRYDAERKLIAQGDVERIAGNIDLATQYYTAAQNINQRSSGATFGQFNGFADTAAATPTPRDGIVVTSADSQDADWRKRTVLQNSYYTEVKNLIDQDSLDDAQAKLDAWAIEFPLSKLGGDFALAEAEYATRFDDFDRAQRILKAYRTRVDLSAQLAEVMQMEWEADAELQRPADIKALAADIKKRFPDLPLAKEAEKALAGQMPKAFLGRDKHSDAAQ